MHYKKVRILVFKYWIWLQILKKMLEQNVYFFLIISYDISLQYIAPVCKWEKMKL